MKGNKKALILAGGEGTRLRPLTLTVPKPLIPVRGWPILDYIIGRLLKYGFEDIYVSLNYRADLIREYLEGKIKQGVRISSFAEAEPLGTAGPLKMFLNSHISLAAGEDILLLNGDILTDLDFNAMQENHARAGADISVAMIDYSHPVNYGIIEIDKEGNILDIKEKPTFTYKASGGIYIINSNCFSLIPDGYFTMPELLHKAKARSRVIKGFKIKEHWLAIEQIKNLVEAGEQGKNDWIGKLIYEN